MIDLYYWPTPNGHKVTLFLEELAEHGKHRMCRAAGRAGRFAVCTAHGSSARLRRVVLIDVFFQHV